MTIINSTRNLAWPFLALALAIPSLRADEGRGGSYVQSNLVSDMPGAAMLQDSDLVNAWGVSFSSSSPFWISDNGTGKATLYAVTYDAVGNVSVVKQGLVVTIPGDGTPTGQVFNGTGAFDGDLFIFASEDGTLSGWRNSLGTTAETLLPGSSTVFKGIALVATGGGPVLLVANFSGGTLDEYDANMNFVQSFTDPNTPAGYAPFNVRQLGGTIFVTFAKQDAKKHDDDPGVGHGFIDTFDLSMSTFTRFATGSNAGGHLREIDSPWGMALAPMSFGSHGGDLLVGNFGSGTIMSFNPNNGRFRGLLRAPHGGPIIIDGLWALTVGNDGNAGRSSTLYFTAGPNGESNGLFGALDPAERGHGHDNGDDGGDD